MLLCLLKPSLGAHTVHRLSFYLRKLLIANQLTGFDMMEDPHAWQKHN